jgi:cytidine kinase
MSKLLQCEAPVLSIYGHVGFDISITPTDEVKLPGGAAYYASLAASTFTDSVGIVTVIGSDFPVEYLRSLNIDMSGITLLDGCSATFYQQYNSNNSVLKFHGSLNVCEKLSPSMIPESFLQSRIFFLATAPPSQQQQALDWLIEKKFGGIISVDTTMAYVDEFNLLLSEYHERIDIVFINIDEYQALRCLPIPKKTVVVKKGAEGASFWRNGDWVSISTRVISRVRTTTGAGDVLAGACLAGIASGIDFETALLQGVKLATESVTEFGVEHLRR